MIKPDHINALFQFCGAGFAFLNVIKIWKDKVLRGYNWKTTAFFTSWGLWNLFYYPYLKQWFSFVAGCALIAVNFTWLALVFYFHKIYPREGR